MGNSLSKSFGISPDTLNEKFGIFEIFDKLQDKYQQSTESSTSFFDTISASTLSDTISPSKSSVISPHDNPNDIKYIGYSQDEIEYMSDWDNLPDAEYAFDYKSFYKIKPSEACCTFPQFCEDDWDAHQRIDELFCPKGVDFDNLDASKIIPPHRLCDDFGHLEDGHFQDCSLPKLVLDAKKYMISKILELQDACACEDKYKEGFNKGYLQCKGLTINQAVENCIDGCKGKYWNYH